MIDSFKDWDSAIHGWKEESTRRKTEETEKEHERLFSSGSDGWWQKAFRDQPSSSERRGHACGEKQMLILIAYDITNHKRLSQIAKHCEDHGVRVQYSLFECRLEADRFERFWMELNDLIDPKEDRLVAYRVCKNCAGEIREAGVMKTTSGTQVVAYVF